MSSPYTFIGMQLSPHGQGWRTEVKPSYLNSSKQVEVRDEERGHSSPFKNISSLEVLHNAYAYIPLAALLMTELAEEAREIYFLF